MADAETFQHYQVLKRPDGTFWELGRGAMGVTYKAFDTNLRCNVALKVINAAYLDSEMARQRFLREARAAAGLSHRNVASVFHLGESGGNYFYAMEFIDGETLEAFVRRRGTLPPLLALQITLQVARALRAASREGLVHRDIKPANLMLLRDDEEDEIWVKVIDFGLAKVVRKDGEASAYITTAGFVGTPHFASPEQLEEKDLDVRSDIYSLGVCLWYMLAGRPPFAGSVGQVMSQHLTRRPAFEQLSGVPPEVVHLLEHLLEKDAAKRPQTASDLRQEIEHVIQALQASAATAASPGKPVSGQAASPEDVHTSFPTEAFTEERSAADGASNAKPLEPASGVVLANRYRILHEVSRGEGFFQAVEIDSGRAVAVKILARDLLQTPEQLQQAQEEVAKARSSPHPSLLEVYSLERSGENTFLAFEWVNGFAVLGLLRQRSALTAREALQLIEPIAAAADHARSHGLPEPDVTPAHILLAFENAMDLPAQTGLIMSPLGSWPPFCPKVLALSLRSGFGSLATWTGQQTIVPMTQSPGVVRQLALLTYELLGGSPTTSANAPGKLPPLAALSEQGNIVLRTALKTGDSAGYATATEFAVALRACVPVSPPESQGRPAGPAAISRVAASAAPAGTPSQAPGGVVVPSPLPSKVIVPPPATSVAEPGTHRTLAMVVIFIVICAFLGLAAGLGLAAWKFLLPEWEHRSADSTPEPHHVSPPPSETPELVRRATPLDPYAPEPTATPLAQETPFATMPPATPSPAYSDRNGRFQELLAKAQDLERDGDAAGALDAYVELAQDYPDQDKGLSRVDSFISGLRAAPLAPDAEQRRAKQLRDPMERAAGMGSSMAMLYLGEHLLKTEPTAAAKWYTEAADKGEPEAMFQLGNMYFNGVGVPKQPAQASHWFALASDKGFVKAKIYLAECYEEGKGGVNQDFDKAFALLNDALTIDPNNSVAMEKLSIDYERGRGTAVDTRKAFSLMKHASDLGDVNAMGNLGIYYMNGLGGVRRDPVMAASLFKQGAEKKSAICMYYYAVCLHDGVPGVPANPAEAVSYYRASAEAGFPPAREWCQQHKVSLAP
jgi:serine/threonine protein kinase/TPR repeat protein